MIIDNGFRSNARSTNVPRDYYSGSDAIDIYGQVTEPSVIEPASSLSNAASLKESNSIFNAGSVRGSGGFDSAYDRAFQKTNISPGELKISTEQELIDNAKNKKSEMAAGLIAAKFITDVNNAQSAYKAVQGAAELNKIQLQNQMDDARFRGQQAGLNARVEGEANADEVRMRLAAQGQSLQGAGARKLAGSYQAMGEFNAALAEMNSIREVYGLELQEVNIDYNTRQAKINRNNQILSSAIDAGMRYAEGRI